MPDKKLTDKDISTLQRMIGKIEGVAFMLENKFATPLFDAIEVIDCVLNRLDSESECPIN